MSTHVQMFDVCSRVGVLVIYVGVRDARDSLVVSVFSQLHDQRGKRRVLRPPSPRASSLKTNNVHKKWVSMSFMSYSRRIDGP